MLRPTVRRPLFPHIRTENTQPYQLRSSIEAEPARFIPYWNPDQYLKDLRANGTDTRRLEQLYRDNPPQDETLFVRKPPKQINPEPIQKLYKKYSKPARKPPLDERIKAFHEAGYSEEELLDIMKKDAKRIEEKPELEKFIYEVFGDINDKKTATVKKKTIVQILKIKKQTFVMPEPDDEELPNDDENEYDEED